ncbi:hypothetical protein [Nannocystis pusilla]|uniref:hypothetical protein n=1 Tax=Nannocystis pusilla TaxID=889268 RepID=UPI003DA5787E
MDDVLEVEGDVEDLVLAGEAIERAAGGLGLSGEVVEEGERGLLVLAVAELIAELDDDEVTTGPLAGVVDRPGRLERGLGGGEVSVERAEDDDTALGIGDPRLLAGRSAGARLLRGVGRGLVLGLGLGLDLLLVGLGSRLGVATASGEDEGEGEGGAMDEGRHGTRDYTAEPGGVIRPGPASAPPGLTGSAAFTEWSHQVASRRVG